METVLKDRKQHRRLFTQACNSFDEEEINLNCADRINKLKLIEEKAILMISCEEKFRQLLYSEETSDTEIDKEIDESESYIDRWRSLKQKLEALVSEQSSSKIESLNVISQPNTLLNYPKIKLPTFDGNVRNWLYFWGQFQKIDEDMNIDSHDKFSYLSQAMEKGSPAEELIKSFPPGGHNYEKALKQLKMRFGREELLIQVYVRDLLALVLQKQNCSENSLRKLFDQLESKLRSLELLGVTREKYAAMLFPLVESSLPAETLVAWERYRSAHRRVRETNSDDTDQSKIIVDKSDLECILEFLQDEVEAEERICLASRSFNPSKPKVEVKCNRFSSARKVVENKMRIGQISGVPSATDLLTSSQVSKQCIFCSNSHYSGDCLKARKIPLSQRESLVKQSHSCFLCLKSGHPVLHCNSKASCLCCGKKHHILLCRKMQQITVPKDNESSEVEKKAEIKSEVDQVLSNVSTTPDVMLQTFKVIIRGNGKKRAARAIVDTASQRSYLLQSTAQEMNYEPHDCEYLQHSLFGGKNTGLCKHDVYTLYLSSVHGDYNCNFKVLSQQIICNSVPPTLNDLCLKELATCNVNIVDDCKDPIEILIGADVAGKLITGRRREIPCGLVAIETKLGWSVMGRMPNTSRENCSSLLITSMLSTVEKITDLWTLDTLGITDPSVKKGRVELEEAARSHFLNTVHVVDDRFEVDLPWLKDYPPPPDYFDLAKRRLSKVVKRLKTESNYEAYENVFKEWLEEGEIEDVPKSDQGQVLYLPHREVIKENSTTKIRPVFDASAKEKGFPSLNDCLEKGPNLLEQIPSILTRFRMEAIGVISDIRRAFLQISVSPTDRDYLRFLWLDGDGLLKEYRHCRVVFGVSSSPFLLNSTIQLHLQTVLEKIATEESSYPKDVIEKLLHSFYVDNCVSCVKNEEELHHFINVSTKVMAERKFELRGWEFNDANADVFDDADVLGLKWNKKSDTLRINTGRINEVCFEKITKRTILSIAHRLFDPLGVCCPVILIPKLMLQETWKQKITWDEEVDTNTRNAFLRWLRDIHYLEDIRFPRYFGLKSMRENTSVHIFCDASRHAYAAVAFIRIESFDSIKVSLIQAKSRVAPTGKEEVTIARLELLAATIASRLSTSILSEIPSEEVYFWTDSSIVLAWITREEAWNVFVQNRVKEIRSLTNKRDWRHIPGTMNPADLPSRGCSSLKLLKSKWWLGPDWLYLPEEKWPKGELDLDENEIFREKKKSIVSSITKCLVSTCLVTKRDWYHRYFSNYRKIINLIAWILRFTFNCRSKPTEKRQGSLDSVEVFEAEKLLIKMIQEDCFENEKDGTTRLVKLQTTNGQLLRPIQRLYPLEITNNDPIVKKYSSEKVRGEICKDTVSDDMTGVRSEALIRNTRTGRIIKAPERLNL